VRAPGPTDQPAVGAGDLRQVRPGGRGTRPPHTLWHTAATLSLWNSANLRQVQAMLRHADPKVTARYAHALNRVAKNPAQRIPVEC